MVLDTAVRGESVEHQELIHLAKQLQKVRNAKKPYYFFFVLEGCDREPALYVERKPADARRKGMAAKSQARKKQVAHGRVELRSRRAVFINETSLSSRKLRKAFRQQLCREKELLSVSPVLKKSDIITVEEDLALTVEAAPITDRKIVKLTAPNAGKKKKKKTKSPSPEDYEEYIARWEKLTSLAGRRHCRTDHH